MKLCIPVCTPSGLQSVIEPRLPIAEHFLLFDNETRQFEHISFLDRQARTGKSVQIDAVLCGSIDRITLRLLTEKGIKVYGTEAILVAHAITRFENDELTSVAAEPDGCREHGHGQLHGNAGGACCNGYGHGAINHEKTSEQHTCNCAGGGCKDHELGHAGGECYGSHDHGPDVVAGNPSGDRLKIAVTSQNRKTVTEHAGKCRKFWVYEVNERAVINKTMIELPIENSFHATLPGQAHSLDSINVLLSGGMGSGLKQKLKQRGIQGFITTQTDPDQAVAEFLAR